MSIPQNRRGFSGWKLTKRPQEPEPMIPEANKAPKGLAIGRAPSQPKRSKGGKKGRYARSSSKLNDYDPNDRNIMQYYQSEENMGRLVGYGGTATSANLAPTEALGSQVNYSQQAAYLGADSGQGTTGIHQNYKSQGEVMTGLPRQHAALRPGNMTYGATSLGESITNI